MISDPWFLKDSFLFVDWEVGCHALTKILSEIPGSSPEKSLPRESFGKKGNIWRYFCYHLGEMAVTQLVIASREATNISGKCPKTTFHYIASSRRLWPNYQ